MPITAVQKNKIIQVVNVFETGSIIGDYANVCIYADGPLGPDDKKIKQITYGSSQTTKLGY
jgi:chitosanase